MNVKHHLSRYSTSGVGLVQCFLELHDGLLLDRSFQLPQNGLALIKKWSDSHKGIPISESEILPTYLMFEHLQEFSEDCKEYIDAQISQNHAIIGIYAGALSLRTPADLSVAMAVAPFTNSNIANKDHLKFLLELLESKRNCYISDAVVRILYVFSNKIPGGKYYLDHRLKWNGEFCVSHYLLWHMGARFKNFWS